jgi:uncharacterized protein
MRKPRSRSARNGRIVIGGGFLFLILCGLGVHYARQRQDVYYAAHPPLTDYLLNEGVALDRADKVAIEDQLKKLDADGAAQLVVALAPRVTSATIAEDALQVGRRYRIGHAGKNDGIVLLIAEQERQARIEVGYGLEGVLTDAQSRLVIADRIAPFLDKGDVGGAARHGVEAILAIVHPAAFAEPVAEKPGLGWLLGAGLFLLIAALIGVGIIQAIFLAIPSARRRIAGSRRWGWFARVRILGGQSRDDERGSTSASSGGIGGGGSFGGGGAND